MRSTPTPLHIIAETARDIESGKLFSQLYLKSRYWHSEQLRHSALEVMPFCLTNSPTTFQQNMTQQYLVGYLWEFVLVYPDVIIAYSDSLEELLQHLVRIFKRLPQLVLVLSGEKCGIAKRNLQYSGMQIQYDTIAATTNRLRQIIGHAQTKTRVELLFSFFGLCDCVCNYMRTKSSQ